MPGSMDRWNDFDRNSLALGFDPFNNIVEGVRQVRGTSYNQVPDAEHVVVSAGPSGLILGRGL